MDRLFTPHYHKGLLITWPLHSRHFSIDSRTNKPFSTVFYVALKIQKKKFSLHKALELRVCLDPHRKYEEMASGNSNGDHNEELRGKVDEITGRVRHESRLSQQGDAHQQRDTGAPGEVVTPPVAQRLETLEVRYNDIHSFMQEIRDSITSGNLVPATSGLAQPRGEPVGNPLPTSSRQSRVPPTGQQRIGRRDTTTGASRHPLLPPALTPQVPIGNGGTRRKPETRFQTPATDYEEYALPRPTHRRPTLSTRERRTPAQGGVYPAPPRRHRTRREARNDSPDNTESSTEPDTDTDLEDRARRDDPTARRLIAQALGRQHQQMGHSTGRDYDITPPAVRPHDALPPDMKRRVKDRTGKKNRRDLTFQEYTCGYARMLLTEIDPDTDLYAMISHLSQVAQDAAAMPWPTVRTWSTTCLDYIEDEQATWADANLFMAERNRIAWAQSRQDDSTPIPCPAYNNDVCKLKAPHTDGELRLLHTCAICYYAAPVNQRIEFTTHNAKSCNRRKRQGGNGESWEQNGKQPYRKGNGSTGNQQKKDNPDTSKPKN